MSSSSALSQSDGLVRALSTDDVGALEAIVSTMSRERYAPATFRIPYSGKSKLVLPEDNVSLMHIAAFFDSLDCFLYLEGKNLLYNQESSGSYLPIHYACLSGSYEVVCYIITKDPKQATVLPAVKYHLIYLATVSGDSEILGLLLANGADMSAAQNIENRPVAHAIRSRRVDCLRFLLKSNLRRTRDTSEWSTLMLAIANNERDAIPLLLESGEDPNYVTRGKYESALFLACFYGEFELIEYIADRTSQLDLDFSIQAKAAIHWACESKSPDVVRMLLRKGIDVNRLDSKGRTGLYYVTDACSEDVVLQIIDIMVKSGLEVSRNPSIIVDFVMAIRKPYRVIDYLFQLGTDPGVMFQGRPVRDYMDAFRDSVLHWPKMKEIYEKWCQPKRRVK
jgi:ankyrin repeat protein